ncbi:MAG: hypothetical protein LBG24_00735 [Treponema sp.]|jgi:hypothetical protein|nr:hypothetical protein [Treponema sp.]
MRKFVVIGIILSIIGGTAFFFGWVQLMVPPGAYGVLRSKTHGVDPKIIRSGEFRWMWYTLIPANAEIQVFTLDQVSHSLSIQETLPSGKEYASFAGFTLDFAYTLRISFSFTIKPDALVTLIDTRHILDQAGLDAFEMNLATQIETFTLQRLRIYTTDIAKLEEMLGTGSIAALEADIRRVFPDIENLMCSIKTQNFPDISLYQQFRMLYTGYLAKQQEYIQSEQTLQPEARMLTHIRFDDLTRYGELLTKYPILLQFLELEQRNQAKSASID